jgi:hypothetical protein
MFVGANAFALPAALANQADEQLRGDQGGQFKVVKTR